MTQPTAQALQSELKESGRLEIEGRKLRNVAERRGRGTQAKIGRLSVGLHVDGDLLTAKLSLDANGECPMYLTIDEALGLAGWLCKHVGTRTAEKT